MFNVIFSSAFVTLNSVSASSGISYSSGTSVSFAIYSPACNVTVTFPSWFVVYVPNTSSGFSFATISNVTPSSAFPSSPVFIIVTYRFTSL